MSYVLRHTVTWVWVIVASATALSWWLGTGQEAGTGRLGTTVVLMVVAFFKVRLVMSYFMELRHAPWPLQLIRDAWIVIVCAVILGLYQVGGAG